MGWLCSPAAWFVVRSYCDVISAHLELVGVTLWDILSGQYRDDSIVQMNEDTLRQFLAGNVDEASVRAPAVGASATGHMPGPSSRSQTNVPTAAQPPRPAPKQVIKLRYEDLHLSIPMDPSATVRDLIAEAARRSGKSATGTVHVLDDPRSKLIQDGPELDLGDHIQQVIAAGADVIVKPRWTPSFYDLTFVSHDVLSVIVRSTRLSRFRHFDKDGTISVF